MAMPSEGCAGAMALSTVRMSISSQQSSVHAACALAEGGVTPKKSACDLPIIRRRSRDAVDVSGHS
eukprot:4657722-Pleurochrysis_carterae.AAC.1